MATVCHLGFVMGTFFGQLKKLFEVFMSVQNLIAINAVIPIIQKFEHLACLA